MKISIVGAGAWGTALATLLAQNRHNVLIWAYEPEVVDLINNTHENSWYLPGITLNKSIRATNDLAQVIDHAQWVFEAVPVKFLRSVLVQAVPYFSADKTWVITSKGIEQETLMVPSQIIDDVFEYKTEQVAISGPSFAHDVAQKDITALTVAAAACAAAQAVQKLLANEYFSPYISLDMLGVQLGGALKNVITLGIGMLDGAGYADNTKAFIFTRGLHEMVELGVQLGAQRETFYGLSGVGDLVLTAMGKRSRNLALGRRLGAGEALQAIVGKTDQFHFPEGINTVQSLQQLMKKQKVDLPVFEGIYQVIFSDISLQEMLKELIKQTVGFQEECA